MGKLRGWFGNMFIKLFLALALASLLAFSGLLYSALGSSREALMRQKSDDMTMFMERTGQYLDLYLQNIRNILIGLSEGLDESLLNRPEDLEQKLREQVDRNNGQLSTLYVQRSSDGAIVSSNQVVLGVVGHPELPRLFRIADETPGLVKWSEPYYTPMQTGPTVAFALHLRNGVGTVVAELNTNQLTRRLYELLQNSEQGFALFTGNGNVVSYDTSSKIVPFRPASLPPEMEPRFVSELIALPKGIATVDGATGKLMAVKSKPNELNWYLVTFTDERDFQAGSRDLLIRFLSVGALWFSLLILLALVISRHFTLPINRLALQMDRIRGERFAAPYRQIRRNDEIGRLSDSFYTMLGRIQELLATVRENEERKKGLELELLLHQIRPHFLYNTLACIGSLAKQHRTAEVEETIRSLIGILTYSIGRSGFVRLEEELKALRDYMQIQNIRYGGVFQYEVAVEPELMSIPLQKLILQPLVENAVFHGLAEKGGGTVFVTASAEEGRMLLTVRDDGSGMTAAQIAAALEPAVAETEDGKLTGRLSGIGLPNVQERLHLQYGPHYGLLIRSEPGLGTEITLVIPLP